MQNKIAFISGIGGSGGSYLAEFLVNNTDYEVHGCTRWHSTTTNNNLESIKDRITIHESDLLDLASLIRIFRKIKPTHIYNLASHANVRVAFDTPLAVLNNNITLTANLLEAIRLECPEAIFQHCSTSEVYGNPLTFPMTEEHPLKPVNPYSVSKLAQESLAYAYHKSWGLKVVTTRMFAYINPRRHDLFATSFARQVVKIERGLQNRLYHGNLGSIRTMVDVRDAMRSYWLASDKCTYGEPYNIGGSDILSVGDFLDKLIKHANCYIQCEQDKNLLRPVDVTKQVCDTTKFDTLTGFKPEYTLDESIDWLLECCRKDIK
jgi:GDP-4-dehydro-6-deoxy-D-mannose reductase